jgi:hypothetical protein
MREVKLHVSKNTTVVIWHQDSEVTNTTVTRDTEHRRKKEALNTTKSVKVTLVDNKSEW